MAFSVIAYVAPNYRDFKNYWLKAYEPGTTTPKSMATDSTLGTLIAKAEINKDGFIESAGGALIIPYIDGSYDLWLFPTEAEADANDTVNAERVADDMEPFNSAGSDLKAIARSLNVLDSDVIYDTDTSTPIPTYIYSASQQKTYAVPADAQGKFIDSVVVDVLNTTTGGPYDLTESQVVDNNNLAITARLPLDIDFSVSVDSLKEQKRIVIPAGEFVVDEKVDFQPVPMSIEGQGEATQLTITNADNTAFRFGATGGSERPITKISNLTFFGLNTTAIDVQQVFPVILDTIRCDGLGASAIKYLSNFYGGIDNLYMRRSGLDWNNVNNMDIHRFDFFGGGVDNGEYPLATDYVSFLDDCDGIKFNSGTFESYTNRLLRLRDCKNITFDDVWIEGNTPDILINAESCSNINIVNSNLELSPSPTVAFIAVNNSVVNGTPRTLNTMINHTGGYLRLSSSPTGFKFVDISVAGQASYYSRGVTLRSGNWHFARGVSPDIAGVSLSTTTGDRDEMKFLQTLTNAKTVNASNNWCPASLSIDYDWTTVNGFGVIGGGGSTATTSVIDETYSGTRSLEISNIANGATDIKVQRTLSEQGVITTDGQTYFTYLRVMVSVDMDVQLKYEGFFSAYETSAKVSLRSNTWYDLVFKSDSDNTFAQGPSGNSKLQIFLTNNSGSTGSFFIDRFDYKVVIGDVYLP